MDISKLMLGVRRNWNRTSFWRSQFHQRVTNHVHGIIYENDGVHVLNEDWDNLIIIDGCRFDLFEEICSDYNLQDKLQKRHSKGSMTREFLSQNFPDEEYTDIVYVTSNPFVHKDVGHKFHHVKNVWVDDWESDLETVHPQSMYDRALEIEDEFPNKKLIIHFMQPHNPFVGDTKIDARGFGSLRNKALGGKGEESQRPDVWELLSDGAVNREDLWVAYRDNLHFVMPHVLQLVNELTGKTTLTSDHGNVFGEKPWPVPIPVYGHSPGIRLPGLVNVPWVKFDYEIRKTIKKGSSGQRSDSNGTSDIEERLEALGYR